MASAIQACRTKAGGLHQASFLGFLWTVIVKKNVLWISPPETISCWCTPGERRQETKAKLVWCSSCELRFGQLHFHLAWKLPIQVPAREALKCACYNIGNYRRQSENIILRNECVFPTASAHKDANFPSALFSRKPSIGPLGINIVSRTCQSLWVKRESSRI